MTAFQYYFRGAIFGGSIGLIIGVVWEIANRIEFEAQQRELERFAAKTGTYICIVYFPRWWFLPVSCCLGFALLSLLLHGLWARRAMR